MLWPIFAENCMKTIKFGPRGGEGRVPVPPLDLPMHESLKDSISERFSSISGPFQWDLELIL